MNRKSGRMSWPALLALLLVPLVAVGVMLGLAKGDDSQVQAAVVNLDEAVTINDQYVPLGRQLAGAMLEREGENISWTLADAPSASAGLESGKYSAVVTIPKEFSAAATSFSENDAETAKQATINVQVSENSPVTDAQVAQQIARLATDSINSTLTQQYLDGIYLGFNTVGEQFTTIVDGAKQLSEGSAQLATGAKEAAQGTNQLNDGMVQLAAGGAQLVTGGDQLASGGKELTDGIGQLSTGSSQLADGLKQFAGQTPKLVDGVGQLATGADQLLGQLPQYTDGAAKAIGGVTQLRQGLDQVITGLDADVDTSDLAKLGAGARQSATGAQGLSSGLNLADQQMQSMAAPSSPLPPDVLKLAAQFGCADPAAPECTGIVGALTAGYKAGVGTGSVILNTADAKTNQSLISGAAALADGSDQLATGVETLTTELPKQTAAQLGQLKTGLTQIRDGAAQLETQAKPIVDNAKPLGDGATSLLEGINQLNTQVSALPDGVNKLSDGASQLSSGVGQLQTGAQTYSAGVAQYVDGVKQYVSGVDQAADGVDELATGMTQLSDGAKQLNEGVGTFARELAKGADQVPSYSAGDRERLATVVSNPVERDDSLMSGSQVALVALIVVGGLWLAALASFLVVRPVPANVVSSRASSLTLWAKTLAIPAALAAAQGVLLGIFGAVVLELSFGRAVTLAALLALIGVAFVLTNHALSGWLGHLGRGIALLLLVVTVALGLSSTAGWLSPVGAVSPLHNAFLLVRTWLAGGTGEVMLVSGAVLMTVIAGVASLLAISSRRKVSANKLLQLHKSA